MRGVASISAVLLAAVFGWAAIAKLRHPAVTRAGFGELRLPFPPVLAVLVPVAELIVAALLIARPPVGAALALAALAIFTLVIIRALSGPAPARCACFGSARAGPVSPADVVRNGFFAAFAILATGTARLCMPRPLGAGAMAAAVLAALAVQALARRGLGGAAG